MKSLDLLILKDKNIINMSSEETLKNIEPYFDNKKLQSILDTITQNADTLETDVNGRIELDLNNKQHREWYEDDK
jgi:hypothetical protein